MSNAKLAQAVAQVNLRRAHAAVCAGDDEAALARLLTAWVAVRDRAIADQIDIVSHRAAQRRPPVTDEASWFARTRDADCVELGRLLEKLPRRASLLVPGLEALCERGPDPRLASVAMRLRAQLPHELTRSLAMLRHLDPAYHETTLALRAAASDPIERSSLDAMLADQQALAQVCALRLDPDGAAWLAMLDVTNVVSKPARSFAAAQNRRRLALATPRLDPGVELLARIAVTPSERRQRKVYADLLQQRGDPHGEFIALQLRDEQGELDRTGGQRVEVLRHQHEREWMGGLAAVLDLERLEFVAGFAARGEFVALDGTQMLGAREAVWLETHPGVSTFV
ncbi:hypothetical protein DB30_06201 [Enhygromyxa salina]|uniref:Uncharacterized protein n=1 Tax=Enhygromyxa salina TaxID=215803 RepID=A0A0C1ZB56_9BACT|nr:TIGR02996 domain-containing protein [Enhygromyxa salina]KIG14899.1 hypothetical protein DB30_06201 [Enhygromyxa salina]